MANSIQPLGDYIIPESSVPLYPGYGPPSNEDVYFGKSIIWYDAKSDEIYICAGNGKWRLIPTVSPLLSIHYTYQYVKRKLSSFYTSFNLWEFC